MPKLDSVHVFCGIHSKLGIIGPFFIDEILSANANRSKASSLTSAKYISLLQDRISPDIRRKLPAEYPFERIRWQQDGALPHTAAESLNFLKNIFGDRIISNKLIERWPPHSPDLAPCDFWLWSQLKTKVGARNSDHPDALKIAIREEIAKITVKEVKKAIQDFPIRIVALKNAQGGHFEPTIKQFKRSLKLGTPCEYCLVEHPCPSIGCDDHCKRLWESSLQNLSDVELDIDD